MLVKRERDKLAVQLESVRTKEKEERGIGREGEREGAMAREEKRERKNTEKMAEELNLAYRKLDKKTVEVSVYYITVCIVHTYTCIYRMHIQSERLGKKVDLLRQSGEYYSKITSFLVTSFYCIRLYM